MMHLISDFKPKREIDLMKDLSAVYVNEKDIAQIIGRMKMYHFLPNEVKKDIPPLLIGDSQISRIAKAYYEDKDFRADDGEISLWNLYNLFTGAVKSSYIDTFIGRNANCLDFITMLKDTIDSSESSWYLN